MNSKIYDLNGEGFRCHMRKRICIRCKNNIESCNGFIDLGLRYCYEDYYYGYRKENTGLIMCESCWQEFKKNIDESIFKKAADN